MKMKQYKWKEKYHSIYGALIADAQYYSVAGSKDGNGTPQFPYQGKILNLSSGEHIFGSGHFFVQHQNQNLMNLIGQGMEQTIMDIINSGTIQTSLKDLTVNTFSGNGRYLTVDCISRPKSIPDRVVAYSSVFYYSNPTSGSKITFVEVDQPALLNTQPLLNRCSLAVNQAFINNNINYYIAFNDCLFQIGAETSASKLNGSDAGELRQSFITRCEMQGLTVKEISEYDETQKAGRWIFTGNSLSGDYRIIENSEIHSFAQKRGFYFGHTPAVVKNVPISSNPVTAMAITPITPITPGLSVSDNAITFDTSLMTQRHISFADSNIIWLGGKYQFNEIGILDNLPRLSGVAIDSIFSFAEAVNSGEIEADMYYIVRSSDGNPASITYNNKLYDTGLFDRNNVFKGLANVSEWVVQSGNPVILPVVDLINYSNIRMRVVTELPTPQITSGNLQAGYWYFVAPNDLTDTSGSVSYAGRIYPCFGSFLVTNPLTFSINGTCHLRRCWRQDYDNPNDETTDKAFWSNRQKPKYFDVVPEDLRCLNIDNSPVADEMQADDRGNYIASGHIDFYSSIKGDSGFLKPAFPIVGSFIQLRIPVSTQNPM